MIDQNKRPRQIEGYMLEELDGELLLYHLDQTKTVYLNNSAALVWHLCDATRTISDIITFLKGNYPEAAEQMPADVLDTVGELYKAGAISLQ